MCVCTYGHMCAGGVCTHASAQHSGAFYIECTQRLRARGPAPAQRAVAAQAAGQGPAPSVHLSIQPTPCNKRQQLTELRTTPSLLLLRHRPSLPRLRLLPLPSSSPGSPGTGHSPSLGCRRQLCPLKSCFPARKAKASSLLPAPFPEPHQQGTTGLQRGRSWKQAGEGAGRCRAQLRAGLNTELQLHHL